MSKSEPYGEASCNHKTVLEVILNRRLSGTKFIVKIAPDMDTIIRAKSRFESVALLQI